MFLPVAVATEDRQEPEEAQEREVQRQVPARRAGHLDPQGVARAPDPIANGLEPHSSAPAAEGPPFLDDGDAAEKVQPELLPVAPGPGDLVLRR